MLLHIHALFAHNQICFSSSRKLICCSCYSYFVSGLFSYQLARKMQSLTAVMMRLVWLIWVKKSWTNWSISLLWLLTEPPPLGSLSAAAAPPPRPAGTPLRQRCVSFVVFTHCMQLCFYSIWATCVWNYEWNIIQASKIQSCCVAVLSPLHVRWCVTTIYCVIHELAVWSTSLNTPSTVAFFFKFRLCGLQGLRGCVVTACICAHDAGSLAKVTNVLIWHVYWLMKAWKVYRGKEIQGCNLGKMKVQAGLMCEQHNNL